MDRIGAVAYCLDLPSSSRIHPVFHISLLKHHKGDIIPNITPSLPPNFIDSHPLLQPTAILDKRHIQKQGTSTEQLLVQWEQTPPEEATWEDVSDLEDKVPFGEGGNDTDLTILDPPPASNSDYAHEKTLIPPMDTTKPTRTSTRQRQQSKWLKDFHLAQQEEPHK